MKSSIMNVPQLVHHYETLECSSTESSPNCSPLKARKQESYSSLRSNLRTMFNHRGQSSRPSSVITDSSSTSPLNSSFGSPTSPYSYPISCSSHLAQYCGTGNPQHIHSPLPFSLSNLPTLMSSKRQAHRMPRPWYTRRTMSQTDLALESESHAEGFENIGLGLLEPRPRQTTVSGQCMQENVVLDGISEVMETAG